MTTNKTTLFIGLNDKDTKRQEISTIEAYKVISNICLEYVGGATISENTGYYTHENGDIVIEKSLEVKIYDATESAIDSVIKACKVALNQESILKQSETVNSCFV